MTTTSPSHRKTVLTVTLGLLLGLILVVRAILPGYALKRVNATLETFSPLYRVHIDDFDLHLWRMAYSFDRVVGTLKTGKQPEFLGIEKMDVSLAWRALFHGRFIADVDLMHANLWLTTASLNAVSGHGLEKSKEEAKDAKDAAIPFDLERLRLVDSRIDFSDVAGLPPDQNFFFDHIDATANNLTPHSRDGLSFFTFQGALQQTARVKGVGQVRTKAEPSEWSVNVEMRNFDLRKINAIATRMASVSFAEGKLNLYSAVQSVDGKMKGYVKPFIRDLTLVGDHRDFKSVKQFLLEIVATVGNFFLKNSETRSLATKISFETVNGKMEVDTSKVLSLAIKNGYGTALKEGLDETYELK